MSKNQEKGGLTCGSVYYTFDHHMAIDYMTLQNNQTIQFLCLYEYQVYIKYLNI